MNIGQRVKILNDYKMGNIEIPGGTVSTVISNLNDLFIIRYGFKDNKELIAGVPRSSVVEASVDEINGVNYENLITKKYHLNKELRLSKDITGFNAGSVFNVIKITLSENENEDSFCLKEKSSGEEIILKKVNIDENFE